MYTPDIAGPFIMKKKKKYKKIISPYIMSLCSGDLKSSGLSHPDVSTTTIQVKP